MGLEDRIRETGTALSADKTPQLPLRAPWPHSSIGVPNFPVQEALLIVGSFWVLTGLLLNEWTIEYLLSLEHLGPLSRLFLWVTDLACLVWGALTIRHRASLFIRNLNLLLGVVLTLCLSTEYALRRWPTLLGQDFANRMVCKYTDAFNGIYYYDPIVKMNFMIPNFQTEMSHNGYVWLHQTDQYGLRNPRPINQADVLLVGDSNIYGHGLNIEQTVGSIIEKLSKHSVVNLARQGDSSFHQAYLLTQYINQFKPRYVFYFPSSSDITRLYWDKTDEELNEFIATPLEKITFKSKMDSAIAIKNAKESYERALRSGSLYALVREKTYLFKIVKWIDTVKQIEQRMVKAQDVRYSPENEESLGWKYTKKAIAYMNLVANRHHAKLVIGPPLEYVQKDLYDKHMVILKNLAIQHQIDIIGENAWNPLDTSLVLAHDGRLNEKGAHTLATIVLQYLRQRTAHRPDVQR